VLVSHGTVVAGSKKITTWSKETHQPQPQS
jgi:hypothetical protein